MESHSPKLLVTLFPRHQNKKQRFLDFTISILSSGKKMCTCSISLFFPPMHKNNVPWSYSSPGFPAARPTLSKTSWKGWMGGRVGNGHWKWTDLWMGGSRGQHCLFFQTLKREIGVQIEYHVISNCDKSILSPNWSKATQFKSLYYI